MNPSDKLVEKYNLKEEMDENGFVIRWYPEKDMDILNDSVVNGKTMIDTTFNRGDCPHNRRLIKFKEQIKGLEEENHILISETAYYKEKMREMSRNVDEYMKNNAAMILTARSAAKKEREEESGKTESTNE